MQALQATATITVGVLIGASAHADYWPMPLAERVAKADFIGVVRVQSVRPSAPDNLPEGPRQRSFLQIADAVVINPVKGREVPTHITINFDNGLTCPNVLYAPDHVYLVFLLRDGDGQYATLNFELGRYEVAFPRFGGRVPRAAAHGGYERLPGVA